MGELIIVGGVQVKLSDQNVKLLAEYRAECKVLVPLYDEANNSIVNGMLTEMLRAEVERMKKARKK